ncbi:SGNH/GDSL hydrolase family protein [Streptomyces hydrogenans]|uniref:hypothetical protein n=1 Tax=Streptomyces hydrogenans TaxID=1873719 RepID=UPI00381F09AD
MAGPHAAAELLRDLPWNRLAVLGDSVTAGVRDPLPGDRARSFADRFTDALAATRPGFAAARSAEGAGGHAGGVKEAILRAGG